MPKEITGLRKLRTVALPAVLTDALAPEPPATFEAEPAPHHKSTISKAEQDQMFREWAAGANMVEVEERYGVSRGYIRAAMQRRFGSKENMLKALQSLVLENAVGVQMIAQEKLPELTGAQAVFAGKLLVETMVKLDEHIQNTPKTINFDELSNLGNAIREVRKLVGPSANPLVPEQPENHS